MSLILTIGLKVIVLSKWVKFMIYRIIQLKLYVILNNQVIWLCHYSKNSIKIY